MKKKSGLQKQIEKIIELNKNKPKGVLIPSDILKLFIKNPNGFNFESKKQWTNLQNQR